MNRLAFLAALALASCAPTSEIETGEGAEDVSAELSLAVVELPVTKSNAEVGLTVITKKADYIAFFGAAPPPDVSFNKHWVLHYSTGVQPTGGYDANILGVERIGSGTSARLVVATESVSPGPGCLVTMALTNPQTTVRIPKQKKSISVEQAWNESMTDCSEPSWCASALCGPGTICDEYTDACVEEPFCPKVKCANGYVCDESVDACVGRPCDPDLADDCPAGFVCDNQIACITQPCPTAFRCEPAPADPCEGYDWVGGCEGTTLKYCDAGELVTIECAPATCGFADGPGYYDCL